MGKVDLGAAWRHVEDRRVTTQQVHACRAAFAAAQETVAGKEAARHELASGSVRLYTVEADGTVRFITGPSASIDG